MPSRCLHPRAPSVLSCAITHPCPLPGEVGGGIGIRVLWPQGIIDVLEVLQVGELRDATGQHLGGKAEGEGRRRQETPSAAPGGDGCAPPNPHQPQQVEEEVGVLADQVVGLAAQVDEVMEAAGGLVPPVDDIRHVRSEDERCPVPAPGREGQKMSTARGHPPPG